MIDRRGFIGGAAAALGTVGCASFGGGDGFYGPTIRDRLWMWGHHKDMSAQSGRHCRAENFSWPGPAVEQAEGCRLMGIPNDCVVRWGNRPEYPWGDYFEQFRSLRRFTFSITDGAKGSVWEKLRIATEELRPKFPNFTGCFLDDFFRPKMRSSHKVDLAKVSEKVHENGLRLSVVLYSDQDGLRPEMKNDLALCDETSFWFWESRNIGTMADTVRRCRDFIGPDKSLLLGLYMWDYSLGEPVSGGRMAEQLGYAERFLAEGYVTGLIFHPSYAAALEVPAVRLAKEWIAAHGEDRLG